MVSTDIGSFKQCKHGCKYCYAKRLNDRFHFVEEWTEPQFGEFEIPYRIPKIPTKRNRIAAQISPSHPLVFVGSMGDYFGDWVPQWFIESLSALEFYEHEGSPRYMFLTKNPKRFGELAVMTGYVGATIESKKQLGRLKDLQDVRFHTASTTKKFVSIEPVLSDFAGVDFSGIDFIIVGAQTGQGARPPELAWLQSINHKRIYFKDNILKYMEGVNQ